MDRAQLYEMMDETLGYAYVYEKGKQGRLEYMFQMTPEHAAHFIAKHAETADKVVLTDMMDRQLVEVHAGGIIFSSADQRLCRQMNPYLEALQQGEDQVKDFPVASREEMEALWAEEEQAVMEAELSMMI